MRMTMTLFEKIKLHKMFPELPVRMTEISVYDGKTWIESSRFEPEQYKEYSEYLVRMVTSGHRVVVRDVPQEEIVNELLDYLSLVPHIDKIMVDD